MAGLPLSNTRTMDSLRPGLMGGFLARWRRACAACALLGNTRATDRARGARFREFLGYLAPRAPGEFNTYEW